MIFTFFNRRIEFPQQKKKNRRIEFQFIVSVLSILLLRQNNNWFLSVNNKFESQIFYSTITFFFFELSLLKLPMNSLFIFTRSKLKKITLTFFLFVKREREHQCNVRKCNECLNFVYVKYMCDILQLKTCHECAQ